MVIRDSFLRDLGRLFIWFPFRWLVASCPCSFARKIAFLMGQIDHLFCTSRRNRIERNLGSVFGRPDIDIRDVSRGIMQTHYLNLLELFRFAGINEHNLFEHVLIEGKDNLDLAMKEGKGVILPTLHFGTMQYPLIALGLLGYKINQLGDRDPDAPEFSYIHRRVALKYRIRIENDFRAKHIHIGKSLRQIYRCLDRKELLMINVDGVGGLKGQRLKKDYLDAFFLGKRVRIPAGAARLAIRTGAPVLPTVCIRQQDGRHKVVIGRPLPVDMEGTGEPAVKRCAQMILSHLEDYVRKYPDHWLMWMEFEKGYMIV